MFINFITPCVRPKNLDEMSKYIKKVVKEDYRWIVVFDATEDQIPKKYIPDNCEYYFCKNPDSGAGNAQRALAFELLIEEGVDKKDQYVYQLDDDTRLHEEFYKTIKPYTEDLIMFQMWYPGPPEWVPSDWEVITAHNGTTQVGSVDTGNYIFKTKFLKATRGIELDDYFSDTHIAQNVEKQIRSKRFIEKPIAIYNGLRRDCPRYPDQQVRTLEL